MPPPAPPDRTGVLPRLAAEVLAAVRFYTRISLPVRPFESTHAPEPFGRALRWAPIAGLAVGVLGGGALAAARALGLPPLVAAALALATTILATGGLHEDGLADVADGFGGGRTREHKLAIMRDSRLGTYGALAVGLSLLIRGAALAALVERGGTGSGVTAMIAAAAVSRGFGLMPLALLPPARPDGLAHGAALPRFTLATACGLAVVIGLGLPWLAGAGLLRPALSLALAAAGAIATTGVAQRQIGGVTGDVAGATQQVSEMAVLIGLLVGPGSG